MNPEFFQQIEGILHSDRLDAYRQDGVDERTTLARYLMNMALSASLYPGLQFAEIALSNAVHREMISRCNTDVWYDTPQARLTHWQQDNLSEAKVTLSRLRKPLTPGRIIAELNFGFWTGFFNHQHARTGVGAFLSRRAFPHAPSQEQVLSGQGPRWKNIRDLRNRVFHHERILHWRDLDQRHQDMLTVIRWMSPELYELTKSFDRFVSIRQDGLNPWIDTLRKNWPATSA
tara:strand:- start:861 stop:1553 length:693 start_codon:yes stop_codon:yes gene_type:complete